MPVISAAPPGLLLAHGGPTEQPQRPRQELRGQLTCREALEARPCRQRLTQMRPRSGR